MTVDRDDTSRFDRETLAVVVESEHVDADGWSAFEDLTQQGDCAQPGRTVEDHDDIRPVTTLRRGASCLLALLHQLGDCGDRRRDGRVPPWLVALKTRHPPRRGAVRGAGVGQQRGPLPVDDVGAAVQEEDDANVEGRVPGSQLAEQGSRYPQDPAAGTRDTHHAELAQVESEGHPVQLQLVAGCVPTFDARRRRKRGGTQPDDQAVRVAGASLPQPGLDALDDPQDGGQIGVVLLAFATLGLDRMVQLGPCAAGRVRMLRLHLASPAAAAPSLAQPGCQQEDRAHQPEEEHRGRTHHRSQGAGQSQRDQEREQRQAGPGRRGRRFRKGHREGLGPGGHPGSAVDEEVPDTVRPSRRRRSDRHAQAQGRASNPQHARGRHHRGADDADPIDAAPVRRVEVRDDDVRRLHVDHGVQA